MIVHPYQAWPAPVVNTPAAGTAASVTVTAGATPLVICGLDATIVAGATAATPINLVFTPPAGGPAPFNGPTLGAVIGGCTIYKRENLNIYVPANSSYTIAFSGNGGAAVSTSIVAWITAY